MSSYDIDRRFCDQSHVASYHMYNSLLIKQNASSLCDIEDS